LQPIGLLDLGDYFSFEVAPATEFPIEGLGVLRFNIRAQLANYEFESFHIDVGVGDPVIGEIEYMETTDLLAFAGLEPTRVPCYPVSQQIAEKLHAYIRPRGSRLSSRVKDFVDMLLLAELMEIDRVELVKAIKATFEHSGIYEIPEKISPPPRDWLQPYRRLSQPVGLEDISLDEAFTLLQKFINPILGGGIQKTRWEPSKWGWK